MNRIRATWQYFSPIRFPFMKKPDPENISSPGRVPTVLFGAVLGSLSCLLLFLAGICSYTAQVICGLLVIPLLLEIICGGAGLQAQTAFLVNRQRGNSFEEALHGACVSEKKNFPYFFLLILIYLFRSALIGALAVCNCYYWLVVVLAGGYFVRAELSTVKLPGGTEFFPGGKEGEYAWHSPLCWLIMLAAGLCHSVNLLPVLIAAGITWLMGSYGSALCSDTEQGMSTNAMRVIGYCAEMFLLFTGVLIYAH